MTRFIYGQLCIFALMPILSSYALAAVSAEKAYAEMQTELRQNLTGQWACRSELAAYQISTETHDEYRADGKYFSESKTRMKRPAGEQQSSIGVEARWSLSGNTVRLSDIQLKSVQADDPAYAERLKALFQQLDWAENKLLSLSGSSLAFLPIAPMASEMPIHCQKQFQFQMQSS